MLRLDLLFSSGWGEFSVGICTVADAVVRIASNLFFFFDDVMHGDEVSERRVTFGKGLFSRIQRHATICQKVSKMLYRVKCTSMSVLVKHGIDHLIWCDLTVYQLKFVYN